VLATFLSDFSHEMATAVLPLYLTSLGFGPAALGVIEGVADFLVSLSKLGGGVLGHHVAQKRPWASLGYLITALATWAMAFMSSVSGFLTLRSIAWIGRGFRGPLRDYLLADAVKSSHYGRAYGLERAGDMLGAVAGPLSAALLVSVGVEFRTVILWTIIPGLFAAGSMFFLTRERSTPMVAVGETLPPASRKAFPTAFWLFLVGVLLFGLGDFSRTFLIWLAAKALEPTANHGAGTVSVALLLYTLHNVTSAAAAYPIGLLGDRHAKLPILLWGYGLGVVTNVLLIFFSDSLAGLVVVVLLSGLYIAVEETLEKAVAAETLPRELRSLGFGYLACANAAGDMASSLYVGYLLEVQKPGWAFGIAAGAGASGLLWIVLALKGGRMRATEKGR
jgi:MFS family permease